MKEIESNRLLYGRRGCFRAVWIRNHADVAALPKVLHEPLLSCQQGWKARFDRPVQGTFRPRADLFRGRGMAGVVDDVFHERDRLTRRRIDAGNHLARVRRVIRLPCHGQRGFQCMVYGATEHDCAFAGGMTQHDPPTFCVAQPIVQHFLAEHFGLSRIIMRSAGGRLVGDHFG